MTAIPDPLSPFIRFIQLQSLRKRTEEDVRWVRRLDRQCGVAWASLLGQAEGLAFLHDLQQNHGDEGSMIIQAGGACPWCEKVWFGRTTVPSLELVSSRGCDPSGVGGGLGEFRGCRFAQPPANRWDPSGIGDDGWICRWVSERGWRVAGVAGVTGLSEPGYNGGGAGRRWGGVSPATTEVARGGRFGGGLAGFMGVEKGGLGLGGSFALAMRGVLE